MIQSPFRVKICGVTAPDQIQPLCQTGIDAIGVNFSGTSARGIGAAIATKISAAKDSSVKLVGIFVNEPIDRIVELVSSVPLDLVQLHGDESWEDYQALAERIGSAKIIRACRLKQSRWDVAQQFAQRSVNANLVPAAILVDSQVAKQYGGTGKRLDWNKLEQRPAPLDRIPLILAGGLTPSNVAQAIRQVQPDSVDTAGGVESMIGMKDIELVRQFAEQARWGWSPNPSVSPTGHFPQTFGV